MGKLLRQLLLIGALLCFALDGQPVSADPLQLEGAAVDLLGTYEAGTFTILNENSSTTDRTCGDTSSLPLPGRWLSSPAASLAVFSRSFGIWQVCGEDFVLSRTWGTPGDIPVPADYNGDGLADYTVYRPATGEWFIEYNAGGIAGAGVATVAFGASGDTPVPADYDGDAKADIAVFRPDATSGGTSWCLKLSGGGEQQIDYGLIRDYPVPADYDGDGKAEIAVWRPDDGVWYIRAADGSTSTKQFGLSGDIPSPGDIDKDGKADQVVYRPSKSLWYVLNSSDGAIRQAALGAVGDRPANESRAVLADRPASLDYDGDRLTDLALLRPKSSGKLQFVLNTGRGTAHAGNGTELGVRGDTVCPGDYDGDGISDFAAVTKDNGYYVWQFLLSGSQAERRTLLQVTYGLDTDQLIPADYDGDGKTDMAVVRNMPDGLKLWVPNASGIPALDPLSWGFASDRAFTADVDGDQRSDYIVVRHVSGQLLWLIRTAAGTALEPQLWGFVGDDPIVGDYNGDGRAEIGVIRITGLYKMVLIYGMAPYYWGLNSDISLSGNYGGTTRVENAVWREAGGQGYFYIRIAAAAAYGLPFGVTGDVPLQPLKPTATSQNNTGTTNRLNCASRSSATAQETGFSWQPTGTGGSLLVTFGAGLSGTILQVALVQSQTSGDVVLETLNSNGVVSGQPTYRGSRAGSAYPANIVLVRQSVDKSVHCIDVPNPGQAY